MPEYSFHPLAEMFPSMNDDDLQSLAKDIGENGQIQPILLLGNQILDGCNRYRACQIAGIEPVTKPYTGNTDEESLIKFVTSANLTRRQLDSSQRAALAVKLLPMLEKAAKERQRAAGGNHGNQHTVKTSEEAVVQIVEQPAENATDTGSTQEPTFTLTDKTESKRSIEQAAELAGTNKQYVAFAKEIQEKRPEILDEVMDGKLTIPKAIKEIRSAEKPRGNSKPPKEHVSILQITYPKKPSSKQDLLDLISRVNDHPEVTDTIPVQFLAGKAFNFEITEKAL